MDLYKNIILMMMFILIMPTIMNFASVDSNGNYKGFADYRAEVSGWNIFQQGERNARTMADSEKMLVAQNENIQDTGSGGISMVQAGILFFSVVTMLITGPIEFYSYAFNSMQTDSVSAAFFFGYFLFITIQMALIGVKLYAWWRNKDTN